MWDERYGGEEYAYGTEANDFLKSVVAKLPQGRALCIGDGEGRNGVWLAEQGFDVTSVDASAVGLAKAEKLAARRNVSVATVHADLKDFVIEPDSWDVVVSIFCHLPSPLRQSLHRSIAVGLKPGGAFVLEGYTPRQLEFGTGGPPAAEVMFNAAMLRDDLMGLRFEHIEELEREVHEGRCHNGHSAVVQLLAFKS